MRPSSASTLRTMARISSARLRSGSTAAPFGVCSSAIVATSQRVRMLRPVLEPLRPRLQPVRQRVDAQGINPELAAGVQQEYRGSLGTAGVRAYLCNRRSDQFRADVVLRGVEPPFRVILCWLAG